MSALAETNNDQFITMVIDSNWTYNMLRSRRSRDPNSDVVATVPVNTNSRPPLDQRFKFLINLTQSSQDYWKLAVGSKAMFISQIATGLQKDYNEHTEGWVIKKYQGQNTLNVFSSEGKTTENVSSSSSASSSADLENTLSSEGKTTENVSSSSSSASSSSADLENNVKAAAQILYNVIQSGGRLLVLTGAGMSVSSGVPVFRAADGTMSEDFLHFLRNYNIARTSNGLEEADDWFSFSVPEMFRKETEKEAWAYWKWRILRSVVEPAEDYNILNTIMARFGKKRTFVKTSNCDMLHERSGVDGKEPSLNTCFLSFKRPNPDFFLFLFFFFTNQTANRIHEIHGSLGRLQCSNKCSNKMYPMNAAFVTKLSTAETDYVPRCIECHEACLRPNVMIFDDNKLVHKELQAQENRFQQFIDTCPNIR